MGTIIFQFIVSVTIATVTCQIQSVRVPPGALVEFEFEFINAQPGQRGAQAGSQMGQGMQTMMVPSGQMMSPMMGGATMGGAGQTMGGAGGMAGSGAMAGEPAPGMGAAGQGMGGAGQGMGGAGQAMGGTGQGMGGAGQGMGGAQMMPRIPPAPPGAPLQQLLTNMARMALALRRMNGIRRPLPPMEEPCPCDADCCNLPMEPRRILPVLHIPMTMHVGCCGCVECPASFSPVISGMVRAAGMAASRRPPRDL